MVKIIIRLIVLLLPLSLMGRGEGDTFVLKDVLYPQKLCVFEDSLIVVDGFTFHLFSLQGVEKITSFGSEGDGPGEIQSNPYWYNSVSFCGDEIFVDAMNKVLYFSKKGQFLREKKKPAGISQMYPFGQYYLGLNQVLLDRDIQNVALLLFDSEMNLMRELAKQVSPVQSGKRTTEVIMDTLNFAVLSDEVFVEKSRDGFVIDVFNSEGQKIREIKKDVERIPVTKRERDASVDYMKNDPTIKNLLGFERFKSMTDFIYPDCFPAITGMMADAKHLYVLTSKQQNGRTECLVLDQQGNELDRVFIPIVNTAPFVSQLLGIQFFTVSDNKLYYSEVDDMFSYLSIYSFSEH